MPFVHSQGFQGDSTITNSCTFHHLPDFPKQQWRWRQRADLVNNSCQRTIKCNLVASLCLLIFHWCKSYLWHWGFFIIEVHFLFDFISNPKPSVWILWRAKISLTPWYQRFTNTFLNFYFGMFLADGELAQLFLEFDVEASQIQRLHWRILLLLSWNQFSTISEMKQNKRKIKITDILLGGYCCWG